MTLALAVVFTAYVAVVLGMAWITLRHPRPEPLPDDALPTMAVVVAARDEEHTIGRCLEALVAQDVPPDKLTIVVADDHSTDGTAAAVRPFLGRDGGPEVRYLRVPDPTDRLRGKPQAIHTGVEAVDAEAILVTDADCAPAPTWARTLSSMLTEDGVGVACGMSRVEARPGRPFDRFQADWEIILASIIAATELGVPSTGVGNDQSFRREAYEGVGGYPALPFSITEDYVLVHAIAQDGWRVRYPLDARSVVWSLPAPTVSHAFGQRRRWTRGGMTADPTGLFPLFVVLLVVHALPLAGLFVAPAAALAALAAKTTADGLYLWAIRRRLGEGVRLSTVLGTEAWLLFYMTAMPVALALRPRIGWKGRVH